MKLLPLASLLLLAAGFSAGVAGAAEAPSPQAPTFGDTMEVNVINLDVQVTDKQGHRVTGLTKKDFEVLEDGKRVEIVNFDALENGAVSGESGVRETGAPATGTAPPSPGEVWNLAVFVDDVNIAPAHRDHVLGQLREFLAREIRPGDRVMLASYDLGLNVRVPFTSDPAAIARGLEEISALPAHGSEADRARYRAADRTMDYVGGSPNLILCPLIIAEPAHNYAQMRRHEVLQSLGALRALVSSLSGMPGRKSVLHVSDGLPITPGEELFQLLASMCPEGVFVDLNAYGGYNPLTKKGRGRLHLPRENPDDQDGQDDPSDDDYNRADQEMAKRAFATYRGASQAPVDAQAYSVAKELEELAAHANANRVTLYTLQASDFQGITTADASGGASKMFRYPMVGDVLRDGLQDSLKLLADETGGRAILNTNDFRTGLANLREDVSTLYSLGISPAHNGDAREHKLTVKAKRPDLRLRYRRSYRDKPALERSADRALAALYYGIEENPLDVQMEIGEQNRTDGGLYAVPVRLRIPLFKLAIVDQDRTFEGKLHLLVAVRDERGDLAPVRQVEVPLHIPRKEVLSALGQYYLYTLTLQMKPGRQHVAVAVRDDLAATTSYLSRAVTAGATVAAARH